MYHVGELEEIVIRSKTLFNTGTVMSSVHRVFTHIITGADTATSLCEDLNAGFGISTWGNWHVAALRLPAE